MRAEIGKAERRGVAAWLAAGKGEPSAGRDAIRQAGGSGERERKNGTARGPRPAASARRAGVGENEGRWEGVHEIRKPIVQLFGALYEK
jgi:hypothetical protein